jgi:hypothetical protein
MAPQSRSGLFIRVHSFSFVVAGGREVMSKNAYARAGVDIKLGNQVKATLPELLASTHRSEALGAVGGFGGLFALNTRKYKQPVLVSSVDGVGTKLKVAFAMNRHDTIGQDLVNHCVDDIAVLGAEPLLPRHRQTQARRVSENRRRICAWLP